MKRWGALMIVVVVVVMSGLSACADEDGQPVRPAPGSVELEASVHATDGSSPSDVLAGLVDRVTSADGAVVAKSVDGERVRMTLSGMSRDNAAVLVSGAAAETRPVESSRAGTCGPPEESPDPTRSLVACDSDGQRYILGPQLFGQGVVLKARVGRSMPDQWVVTVSYRHDAARRWLDYTSSHIGESTAVVESGVVVSAAVINGVIIGDTEISGGFTRDEAQRLGLAFTSTGDSIVFSDVVLTGA
ncbi:SecDF P1 head subdomain-containing protein [Gordonia malaquae]|uniref:SecDF P1 head subdomain-containing protein n=1 Tax=Gordonia malaquae TaxID=410332 RepID=UPI0030FEED1D